MEVKIDLSNKFQDFNPMNDGLARVPLRGTPIELDDDNDEGYGTQSQAAIDRKMRSASREFQHLLMPILNTNTTP